MKKALWLLPVLLLTGCASPLPGRDVSRMQLISTLGIDGTAGNITVSVSSRGEGEELPGMRSSGQGESIQLAIRSLEQGGADGEPYFAHVQYVLCDAEAAGYGMTPLLDYFQRTTQTRLDVPLYIIKESGAEALITGGEENAPEITALLAALEQESARRGTPDATVLSVARDLERQGCALCSAVSAEEQDGSPVPRRDGYAVVRRDAPALFLTGDTAAGAALLTGRGTGLLVPLPEGVTVELRQVTADAVPRPEGLLFTVDVTAALVECDGDAPSLEELNVSLSDYLARCVDAAAGFMADRDADFADLFSRWHREFRDIFPTREEFFRSMTWETDARGTVERSYDIADVEEDRHA